MVLRVLMPGLFFFLALLAGVGMYSFSGLAPAAPNPLLATQGSVSRPVPVGPAPAQPDEGGRSPGSTWVRSPASGGPLAAPADAGVTGMAGRAETRQITLYLASKADPSKLVAHAVTMDTAPGTRDLVDRVVLALQGPFEDAGVLPTVPRGTRLLSVFVMRKLLIVNLSRDVAMAHGGGTLGARMTIYSLVNSLIDLGLAEEVKILVQGREEIAFTDHLDLTRPLTFEASVIQNRQLVQDPAPAEASPAAGLPGEKALKAIGGSTAAVGAAGSGR